MDDSLPGLCELRLRTQRAMTLRTLPLLLAVLAAQTAAYYAPSAAAAANRCRPAVMKGRGTRGMPGKGVRPPAGSGFNKKSKQRMQSRELSRDCLLYTSPSPRDS